MQGKRVKKLVADSAAFIRNAQMQVRRPYSQTFSRWILTWRSTFFVTFKDIAEIVYTTRDVIDEIRDQATKQRLRVLPYEISVVEPTTESLQRSKPPRNQLHSRLSLYIKFSIFSNRVL